MAIPSEIVGAGNNSTAQNVIRVQFSEALAEVPKLKAWDNFNCNSTSHEIFTGTTGNGNKPMLCAVATTDNPPANADWKPDDAVAGGATINRLKGSDSYVNLSTNPPGQNESVRFNLCWEIPYDASVPADLDCVIFIEYSYSGAAPTLTWYFNDKDAGGTEDTPAWTQIAAGSAGNTLKPADANCTSSNIVLHKPAQGVLDNPALWVV